ncbi:MAG: arginyltransferase [Alphaproteobacteria bacterium]|nr:arginyltransferase [Alphaproteobacteria bacterium]
MSVPPAPAARFYYSAPAPCPYIDGRIERRIFADLSGPSAAFSYDLLSEAGFRRSLGFAYRPACPGCNACVPVRIPAREFEWSRHWRRVLRMNADVSIAWAPARATAEQYQLFQRYQAARHQDGDMARMDAGDFRTMIEVGAIDSAIAEMRDAEGRLLGACLTDRMARGVSAVYTFFDPNEARRSLGTRAVLWLVEQSVIEGLDHVYLGYWIAESRKMAYKARFHPLEGLTRDGWQRLDIGRAASG